MLLAKPQMEETRRHRVIVGVSLDFLTTASPLKNARRKTRLWNMTVT